MTPELSIGYHANMENVLAIHTDGGARGNPGPAAVGVVIERGGVLIHKFGKTIGKSTNNVAEYMGVIEAMQYIKRLHTTNDTAPAGGQDLRIQFYLDSKLVVEQLNGRFKVKDAKLRDLLFRIRVLEQDLSAGRRGSGSIITYTAISREQNRHADLLVNQALDGLSS